MTDRPLDQRRHRLDRERSRFEGGDARELPEDIRESWRRCRETVDVSARPEERAADAADRWDASPIRHAEDLLAELGEVAASEDFVAVVTDPDGRILWSRGSRGMEDEADRANFVPGADWSEATAGTNAPALSVANDRPTTVFAGEHWCEPVQEWVCYAAPVHDAAGSIVGSIDLSSTWTRANDMARSTVRSMARLIDVRLSAVPVASSVLDIRVLGLPRVTLGGRTIDLTLRQIEILTVLALDGPSTLGEIHAHIYGDRAVSTTTLKAEISHLRKRLGGAIGSRPYELTVPVTVDVERLESSVRAGAYGAAVGLYRGQLLPDSESPFIIDERHRYDVFLRTSLLDSGGPQDLLRFARVHPYDVDVVMAAEQRITPSDGCRPDLSAAIARLRREGMLADTPDR